MSGVSLRDAIEEIKPFNAADFRAKDVQDRSSEPDGAEPDEEV